MIQMWKHWAAVLCLCVTHTHLCEGVTIETASNLNHHSAPSLQPFEDTTAVSPETAPPGVPDTLSCHGYSS